jgi:hypothetical protein
MYLRRTPPSRRVPFISLQLAEGIEIFVQFLWVVTKPWDLIL